MEKESPKMRSFHCLRVLLIGLALLFQGCGDTEVEKSKAEATQSREVIAKLQSQLAEARDGLARQQAENRQLSETVRTFDQKIAQIQVAAEKAAEESRRRREASSATPEGNGDADQSRITLMGAKAVAEFKAAQLSQRLERLKKDLDRKEEELARIREDAQKKDDEIQMLTKKVEELQAQDQTRSAEVNSKLEHLGKELEKRSAESRQLKKDLDDKVGLLEALKNAVADAGRLKATAEAEASGLSNQISELTRQLTASQNDVKACRQEIARLQSEGEGRRQEVASLQTESEGFRQEIVRLQGLIEKSRQETARLQGEMQQARKDRELYLQEATRLSLELEARQKEVQELRTLNTDLSSHVEALEQRVTALSEELPSTVDQILRGPSVSEVPETAPNLY
jgi:chromosome segregation ATPase